MDSEAELAPAAISEIDLFVIGGGINGAGIARDAAGRGLSVALCEQDDLAHHTSSRSGKLVHGGLRYLEYYEFRLVREALVEREVLLESAPHIIWPMRFVLPHSPDARPAWLIRTGLFLYDHLGGRKRLPGTRMLDLAKVAEGEAIKDEYRKAFEFSDCWVDDARLVVLNALDAQQRGATVLPRTQFTQAKRDSDHWLIEARDIGTGKRLVFKSRALVNAAGPWVNRVINQLEDAQSKRQVRLVKGSHIVVKKFWHGDQAYLLQNTDKRVLFINPYEGDKTLIGTTDVPYDGAPESVAIDASEIDYLIDVVNRYFKTQLTPADILQSFSGVRALFDDKSDNPSAVTRDYEFDLDEQSGQLPLLSVFGGKITTFRKLAEHALQKLQPFFPQMGPTWTANSHLPGGNIDAPDFDTFLQRMRQRFSWLPPDLARHYARLYGTRCDELLNGAGTMTDLGRHFGQQCYERELAFLIEHEWARTVEDILFRRTKHGLHLTGQQQESISEWMARRPPAN